MLTSWLSCTSSDTPIAANHGETSLNCNVRGVLNAAPVLEAIFRFIQTHIPVKVESSQTKRVNTCYVQDLHHFDFDVLSWSIFLCPTLYHQFINVLNHLQPRERPEVDHTIPNFEPRSHQDYQPLDD